MAAFNTSPYVIHIDDEADKEEFILDVAKVKLVEEVQDKLQKSLSISLTYGDICEDEDSRKQWVEISGEVEDRKAAKEYIQTLCNPVEVQPMKYPAELEGTLTAQHIQERVEKQSRAVVRFEQAGEVLIYGNDRLAVTLAYSALEDVISQHLDENTGDFEGSTIQRQASHRLDLELKRRLSNESGNMTDSDDLKDMSNAIKRTILDVLHSRNPSDGDNMESYGITPHRVLDFSKKSDTIATDGTIATDIGEVKTSLGEAAEQLRQIQLMSSTAVSNDDKTDSAQAAARDQRSETNQGKYLRNWAISQGFSEEKVNILFQKHGYDLPFQEFYRALNDIKDAPPQSTKVATIQHDQVEAVPVQSVKNINTQNVVGESQPYIAQLIRDHSEEKDLSKDELMQRNAERQRLLMGIFEKRKRYQDDSDTNNKADADPVSVKEQHGDHLDHLQQHRHIEQDKLSSALSSRLQPSNIQRTQDEHRHYQSGRSPSPKRYRTDHHTRNKDPHFGDKRQQQRSPPGLRYIVIDGSNVAFTHGNGKVFSCRGIQLCIDYFLKRGHTEITAFVPQWRTRMHSHENPISDQHILDILKKNGHLVFTPSRRVPGKNIVCYDDRYVLRLAQETDGIVVSNDNYRDLWRENTGWRPIIEMRLLMFSFVRDIFMPPDDPLGKDGPTLDNFLLKHDHISYNLKSRDSSYQSGPHESGRHPPSQRYQQHPSQRMQHRPLMPNPRPWNQHVQKQSHASLFQGQGVMRPFSVRSPHVQDQRLIPQQSGSQHRDQIQTDAEPMIVSQSNPASQDSVWQPVTKKRSGGHQRASRTAPRNKTATEQLRTQLKSIFSEEETAIERILTDHPSETDLNILSDYLLTYMDTAN